MDTIREQQRFCDREFTAQEVSMIQEVVQTCKGLSRLELAHTVCELLDWKRPSGRLKARECRDLLERLEGQGVLRLPEKKSSGPRTVAKQRIATAATEHSPSPLTGSVETFLPLQVELVQNKLQRQLFRELVGRYHYLGYTIPYGARLQYLIYVDRPRRDVVGCVQFSSPAWQIKVRDQWIGWDDASRKLRLQHVVNNSRFLVLARIDNLASKILSDVMRHLHGDWLGQYGVEPWLVETMVEQQRFYGGCYRAANFQEIGQTTGRGRMDRTHQRHGADIKTVLLYPLVKHARRKLAVGR
ncbi:MAG: Druantia anti-phage system protein DruA [Pseudomonadota bacterium]